MFTIVKPSEIDTVLGTEVGVSDWVTIDQDRINKFADATMDHQFIHVDPEQATPVFGSTIAHGFLSLSMVCLLYTSPSPRDRTRSRMPSSA